MIKTKNYLHTSILIHSLSKILQSETIKITILAIR